MDWLILLIAILLTAGLSGLIVYRILRPRLKAVQELDEQTRYENECLYKENDNLKHHNLDLHNENDYLKSERDKLIIQKDSAIEQIQNLNNSIAAMEIQAQEAADLFYNSKMQVAQEHLERALEEESKKFQEDVENFNIQYKEIITNLMQEYKALEGNVATMRATNDAAVAAAKRAEEMKDQENYYRIQLSPTDIHEIELLRQVEPYLRDKEPLNKVIWKCYYEKPTTDLIGRVIGSGIHTGIYKITEISTGKCYVGQAANLADRWKQHIKRGVGADAPTRNKLYPAMIAAGPENFTFEVIEICDRAALDAREDYWQDYFKAKEFGYSIK